jgi:hypothetical protein
MGSPTLQTLQEPILLTPWLCFRGGGFPNLGATVRADNHRALGARDAVCHLSRAVWVSARRWAYLCAEHSTVAVLAFSLATESTNSRARVPEGSFVVVRAAGSIATDAALAPTRSVDVGRLERGLTLWCGPSSPRAHLIQ